MNSPAKIATYASVIGVVLGEERERNSMTQAAAARQAGVTQSTWARMELGRACTMENLGKAAAVLNIEIWKLIKAVVDRVIGREAQGIRVVFEAPNENEVKSAPETWVTGSSLRTLSIIGLGVASSAALSGVRAYIASTLNKQDDQEDRKD
jgi:transcriptional regulator with XRE-family HTH domain